MSASYGEHRHHTPSGAASLLRAPNFSVGEVARGNGRRRDYVNAVVSRLSDHLQRGRNREHRLDMRKRKGLRVARSRRGNFPDFLDETARRRAVRNPLDENYPCNRCHIFSLSVPRHVSMRVGTMVSPRLSHELSSHRNLRVSTTDERTLNKR